MNHTGRKIMINGGDCFVKKYLTAEKNVLIDGVNQEKMCIRDSHTSGLNQWTQQITNAAGLNR